MLDYLHKRRWRLALTAGILLLVAFKRISFAGVALAIGFEVALTRSMSLRNARLVALATVVGLSIVAIFSVYIFEDVANSLKLEDSSADAISLGRYDIALRLWDRLHGGSLLNWVIGLGPGAADLVSEDYAMLNPHNDWLKIMFDYGIFGSAVVHAVLFLNLTRHRLGLMIYIYTAVLMITDNVFIYMFYYPFVVLIMSTQREDRLTTEGFC